MLILPSAARRRWRLSLWLVLSPIGGAALATVATLAGIGGPSALLVALGTLGCAAVGVLWPGATRRLYAQWNACAVWVARAASAILRRLCFYVVLVAAGWAGSTLAIERPTAGRSLWVPRNAVGGGTYLHPHAAGEGGAPPGGWIEAYVRWAVGSNSAWALCLLPFWLLLFAFRYEQPEAGVPTHTYTLF